MDLYLIMIVFVFLGLISWILKRGWVESVKIQEAGKLERTKVNSLERTNKSKVEGLFEMQLQKLAQNAVDPGGTEIADMMAIIGALKNSKDSDPKLNQGLSWEVLKEQLKNPEVKTLIKDHQGEILEILK